MARPREFDETAVLAASAKQFRMHGFADTSTEQLCEAAGVRRSSLYNTFISKDELFIRSLEWQIAEAMDHQEAILRRGDLSGHARLAALFELILQEEEQAQGEGHAAGCMIVASRMAPAIGKKEPRIQRLLDSYMTSQLALVEEAVTAGCLDGSLRQDLAPGDAALMVATFMSGIRVMSQSGSDISSLRRAALLHLEALRADNRHQ